jgi:transposase
MRGKPQAQPDFLTVINLNQCVPADHPLRAIKQRVDLVLQKLSPLFDELYAAGGRDSIPPEQLLKARVLTALYSVRSERLFCEQLGYNLLWLWFLDREFSEGSFNHSIFAKNYDRVLSADVAKLFFAEIYNLSRQEGWTSDDHFTADGTLIESWASLKSFVRKDGRDQQKVQSAKDNDPGNPTINFHGEKRCNDTHHSTSDGDSVLYRKAKGKEAKLSFGAHLLMENRNGDSWTRTLSCIRRSRPRPLGRIRITIKNFSSVVVASARSRHMWRAKPALKSKAWTRERRSRPVIRLASESASAWKRSSVGSRRWAGCAGAATGDWSAPKLGATS